MTTLTDLAASIFQEVGGPDWRTDLMLGGVAAIVALVVVCGLLTVALLRGGSR